MKNNRIIRSLIPLLACGMFHVTATYAQEGHLEDYIALAMTHNPRLEASRLQYEISKEKQEEVQTLPNTEFGFGYFVSEPETRTGAQKAKFSVKQMIPWFGSITSREHYASSMAEAEYQNIAILQRQLVRDLSATYYNLYTLKAQQEVIGDQLALLVAYRQVTLAAVESGNAGIADVLKLQIRENELKNKKAILETRYNATEVAFINLMGTSPEQHIALPDTLTLLPEGLDRSYEISAVHPELLKYDQLYESVVQMEALNRKEGSPNLGIGLDYIPVAERTDVELSDNGKDIIMPMVSISIPIFNKKYRSVDRQAELQKQKLELEKQERINQLQTLLSNATENTRAARLNVETALKNIEETHKVLAIMKQRFQTGSIRMTELLEILELQLDLELNIQKEINTYYQQLLTVNYLSQ